VLQLLKNPNFDFMSRRAIWLGFSSVMMVASIVVVGVKGLNLGIEFSGGSEVLVKFADRPDIAKIRSVLEDAGIPGTSVTTRGQASENEVAIRVAGVEQAASEDEAERIHEALGKGLFQLERDRVDLNIVDVTSLAALLEKGPGAADRDNEQVAKQIIDRRRDVAIFHSVDELSDVQGVDAGVLDYLRSHASVGPVAHRGQSYIGPAIGSELMRKAMVAIGGSLAGMLIYIWIRFQLQWGFAAVVALTHDTVITLGLFSLFDKELSLAVVAAFLTLIGYSVNDTVVVFDRIRENLANRRGDGMIDTINLSINQTLSRTVITSGLTWIVVCGLLVFGGAALNPFSFVLTVGVLVGTYSSIYVASPFLLIWSRFLERRKQGSRASATSA